MTERNLGSYMSYFFADVIDNKDPKECGRCKIRVNGVHDDKTNVKDTDLPWSKMLMPPTSASTNGVGMSPTGLQKGSKVFGIWLDQDKTIPMILGSLHGDNSAANGVNDVNSLVRQNSPKAGIDQAFKNTNQQQTIDGATSSFLPIKSYDNKITYPNAFTYKTQAGHEILINDTNGNESIRVIAKSGQLIELTPDGKIVFSAPNGIHSYTSADSTEKVKGNQIVEIQGNATVAVKGNMSYNVTGNMTISSDGSMTLTSKGGTTISSPQTVSMLSDQSVKLTAKSTIELDGAPVKSKIPIVPL